MSNNRSPKEMVYNSELPFKIETRGWFTGNCELREVKGCEGFVLEPHRSAEPNTSLETNFFSIELLEANPDDSKELAKFMGRYGLFDCPYRERSVPPLEYSDDSVLLAAVRKTNNVRESLREEYEEKMMLAIQGKSEDFLLSNSDFFALVPNHFVSLDEAVAVLRLLQDIVNGLFSRLDGMGWEDSHLLEFVNANVGNYSQIVNTEFKNEPIIIPEGSFPVEVLSLGSLTCAISNQIVETIGDKAEWYKCKAANCRHWFKRKRGPGAPRTNSEYCSTRCSGRMRKRRQRGTADTSTQ